MIDNKEYSKDEIKDLMKNIESIKFKKFPREKFKQIKN